MPRRVANAWTQPGDLGVSSHDFLEGACVTCLYLPDGEQKNEDQIIAESFGVTERLMQVRTLLYQNEGAPRDLLVAIATARDLPLAKLLPFEGRPVRALYTEGFCGGAVIPLGGSGRPANDVHVPLAHQSALAGVLLAAAGVRMGLSERVDSESYRIFRRAYSLRASARGGGPETLHRRVARATRTHLCPMTTWADEPWRIHHRRHARRELAHGSRGRALRRRRRRLAHGGG